MKKILLVAAFAALIFTFSACGGGKSSANNNIVKVSFTIAQDNTMKGMQVLESSGSDQIDEIVLRSIKNTLKYISVPKIKDFKSDYFLTLIINF